MKATPGTLLHVRRKCQSAIERNIETGDFSRYSNVNIDQSNRTDVELGQLLRRVQPVLTVFILRRLEDIQELMSSIHAVTVGTGHNTRQVQMEVDRRVVSVRMSNQSMSVNDIEYISRVQ